MSKIIAGIAMAAAIVFTGGAALAALAPYMSAAAIAMAVTAVNALALSQILGGVISQFSPRSGTAGSSSVQQEYSGTIEPRRIVLGKMKVSGLNAIPPITTGVSNEMLHQILIVAGHPINGYYQLFANTEQVSPNATSGGPGDGLVTGGTYAGKMWLRKYDGSQTSVDYILHAAAASTWTVNHKLQGLPYLAIQFQKDDKAYASGKPDISAVLLGANVYDPRADIAPGHDPNGVLNYSTNPALLAAWYLINTTVGRRVDPTRIDWASVVAAANICDESLAGGNAPPTGAQPRYTCNVVLTAAQTPEEHDNNLQIIAGSMMGVIYRSAGVWRMYAGAWSTPTFTIDTSVIVGSVKVDQTAIRDSFNTVRATFLDPTNNWQTADMPEIYSSAYISTDGAQRFKDLQFPACTDVYEAERDAMILLRQSRDRKTFSVECSLAAFKVRIWETGTLTVPELGLSSQSVRCIGWSMTPDGKVALILREEYSTDWANPASSDYKVPGTPATPVGGITSAGVPVSLTTTSLVGGIQFNIGQGDPFLTGQTYRVYQAAHGGAFSSATLIATVQASSFAYQTGDTTTRDYWATSVWHGIESAHYPSGSGVTGAGRTATSSDITPDPGWINTNISIVAGTISGIGTGSGTAVDNAHISIVSGAITGIGTGSGTAVANSNISIASNGVLSGAGGGAVTIGGLGYAGDLNATYGATLGVNVAGQITSGNATTLIAGGALDTPQLAGNSVSQMVSNFSAAGYPCQTTLTHTLVEFDIISATLVTTGGAVAVDIGFVANMLSPNGTSMEVCDVQVYRDGTSIGSAVWDPTYGGTVGVGYNAYPNSGLPQVTISATDAPSAGTHTYTMHARVQRGNLTSGAPRLLATNNFIKVREIKR